MVFRLDPERRAWLLAEPDPTAGPVDVVIDTDVTNEIDDQFAIVWAFLRPDRCNVVGLTACPFGFDPDVLLGAARPTLDKRRSSRGIASIPRLDPAEGVVRARDELLAMCDLLGAPRDLVAIGADRYMGAIDDPVASPAVDLIVDLARARSDGDGPLQVLAIGCATNVASALVMAPDIAERITVVWTSAYPSFWPHPNASYNLAQDLPGARVLFGSGAAHVYLPGYYVGEELRVTLPEIEAYVAGTGPAGEYLASIYRAFEGERGRRPGRSKVIWDLINVAWVVDPHLLVTHLVPAPDLGEDLRWVHHDDPERHVMREAVDVNRDAIFADLYRVLGEAAN